MAVEIVSGSTLKLGSPLGLESRVRHSVVTVGVSVKGVGGCIMPTRVLATIEAEMCACGQEGMGAQLGLRQCEGVEIHLCVCSMSERQKQRSGAAENSEECSCTLEPFVHKSAPSLAHICTRARARTRMQTHTRAHTHSKKRCTPLKDRPSDLAKRSFLCCLATRLSPRVESTHTAPFYLTDGVSSKPELIQKRFLQRNASLTAGRQFHINRRSAGKFLHLGWSPVHKSTDGDTEIIIQASACLNKLKSKDNALRLDGSLRTLADAALIQAAAEPKIKFTSTCNKEFCFVFFKQQVFQKWLPNLNQLHLLN